MKPSGNPCGGVSSYYPALCGGVSLRKGVGQSVPGSGTL